MKRKEKKTEALSMQHSMEFLNTPGAPYQRGVINRIPMINYDSFTEDYWDAVIQLIRILNVNNFIALDTVHFSNHPIYGATQSKYKLEVLKLANIRHGNHSWYPSYNIKLVNSCQSIHKLKDEYRYSNAFGVWEICQLIIMEPKILSLLTSKKLNILCLGDDFGSFSTPFIGPYKEKYQLGAIDNDFFFKPSVFLST